MIVDLNLDEIMGIVRRSKHFITPAKIIKTPLSKTFAEEVAVKQIKNIIKTTKPKPFTFDYVDDVTSGSQKLVQESKFAGTGLYERTEGVAGASIDSQTLQINKALQSGFTPTINVQTQIKNLLMFNQATIQSTRLGIASLSALRLSQGLKQELKMDLKLGQELKLDLGLKQGLSLKQLLKEGQALKQAQSLRQGLKLRQALKLQPAQAPSFTGLFAEPVIPSFKLPPFKFVPFILPFPLAKSRVKRKMEEKKLIQELALLPDFTAKALGLDPEELTGEQVLKKMRKVKTGFGIRRSIKLLKGIPD